MLAGHARAADPAGVAVVGDMLLRLHDVLLEHVSNHLTANVANRALHERRRAGMRRAVAVVFPFAALIFFALLNQLLVLARFSRAALCTHAVGERMQLGSRRRFFLLRAPHAAVVTAPRILAGGFGGMRAAVAVVFPTALHVIPNALPLIRVLAGIHMPAIQANALVVIAMRRRLRHTGFQQRLLRLIAMAAKRRLINVHNALMVLFVDALPALALAKLPFRIVNLRALMRADVSAVPALTFFRVAVS